MRPLACLVLVLAALAPAVAGMPRGSSALEGDARLDAPVTVQAKKVTLYDLLRDLSTQTGVKMAPDRAVVDEPLMLAVTKVPAREVLSEIATLTRFTWLRNGGTTARPTYLLVKDLAAAREEQEELTKAQREVLAAIQEELRRCREFARLSPEQAQRELERADREFETALQGAFAGEGGAASLQSPRTMRRMLDGMTLRAAASPTGRVMLQVLDGLTPAHWDAVMAEEPVVFSTRPREGELLLAPRLADALRANSPGLPFPRSLFRQFGEQAEQGIGQVEGMMRDQWGKADGFSVGVQLTMQAGAQPLGILRVAPTPLTPARGMGGGMGMADGLDALFGMAGLNLMGMPALLTEEEDPAAREKRLSADPVLGRKAKLKLPAAPGPADPAAPPALGGMAALFSGRRAAEVLPLVEKAFGVRIVGDAYNAQALTFFPGSGEVELPLFKALDQIAGGGRNWTLTGGTVRIKSKTWAFDRRREIPVRYMKRWLEVRKRKGGFGLDDLAEIATALRNEQVESLMMAAMEVDEGDDAAGEFAMVSMNRDVLRFWGRLLPLQRRNLLAGQSIAARTLYPQQQQALLALSRAKGGTMFALAMAIRPARPAAQLAEGVVSLEFQPLGVGGDAPPAGGRARPPTGQAGGMYTLRVSFPNGEKDDYRILLMRPGAETIPAPPAAARPAPQPGR